MRHQDFNTNRLKRSDQDTLSRIEALISSDKQSTAEEVAMRSDETSSTKGPGFTATGDRAERGGCRAKDAFRIGFGVIWLIDAAFKWQSGFVHGFRGMVNAAGQGQPSWLQWFYTLSHNVFTPHAYVWAYAIAALETLVGLALVFGFARKATYVLTFLTSIGIWAVAEGFGGPYGSGSTDIGAAVMYAVVALGLLALNYEAGVSRFSVDYLLEQRIPWWHRVAEVDRRRQPESERASHRQLPLGNAHPTGNAHPAS